MNIRPTKDRLIVEVKEEPEKIGSIYVPDNVKNKPKSKEGAVLAVGPDVIEIKVGDTVIFEKYSGSKVDILNDNILIINSSDVCCVVV
jgi:chaperonin GroES